MSEVTNNPDNEIAITHSHPNSNIPSELYSRILEHTHDKTTLLSMLVSSKYIYREAERKLYHSIKCETSRGHRRFLEAILDPKRTHLSRLVRRYYLYKAPVNAFGFTSLLERALPTLINLKHLSFWATAGLPSAKVLPIKDPCPFQLHSFQWFRGHDEPYIAKFLNTQHSIEVLSMFLKPPGFHIPRTALRNLRNLHGSIGVILEVLPSRDDITCLSWAPFSEPLPENIPPFPNVRMLSLGPMGSRPEFGIIVPIFHFIEVLQLDNLETSDLPALYQLVHLRILILSDQHSGRTSAIIPQDTFQNMTCLDRIDLATGHCMDSNYHVSRKYQRWERGAIEPVEVDASKAIWWLELGIEFK